MGMVYQALGSVEVVEMLDQGIPLQTRMIKVFTRATRKIYQPARNQCRPWRPRQRLRGNVRIQGARLPPRNTMLFGRNRPNAQWYID